MYVIQFTRKEDEYEKWFTQEYQNLEKAVRVYEEYSKYERYDQVRLMAVIQSVSKK